MIEDLILHKSTQLQIKSALANENLHALGLKGASGSGKFYLAKSIASELLNSKNIAQDPYCLIIDCEKDSGIETVRSIKKFLNLRVPGKNALNRCLILKSIQNLTDEAQNALLKTIEEPPKGTLIIVTCDFMNQLRPTVVSRMQWIDVLPLDKKTLKTEFSGGLSEVKFDQSYAISQGNIVSFLKLIGEIKDDNDVKIESIKRAKELISMIRFERMCEIEKIIKDDPLKSIEILESMKQVLRAVLLSSVKSGKKIDNNKIMQKIELINQAEKNLSNNISEKLVLTNLFHKL
ncbi:hypothetical protein HZB74_03720 [Candidatus Saccharibacteria bacterium]|nr:hypothetical protein [Candidatus Saccharibacteria bacterium]